jgi:aminoglycoside phosphotransferase (APT) family kinase protein
MPFDRIYRDVTGYQKSDPQEHYKHLEMYLQILDRLIPKEPFLNRPTLRHPDLNPNNIFISNEADIVGLIDWQHSRILPFFLTSRDFRSFPELR